MAVKGFFICLVIIMGCFKLLRFAESKLPQEEVDALTQITSTLGARYWKFNGDSCQIEMVGLTTEAPRGSENSIVCDCPDDNSSVCHVVSIVLKGYSLPGMLPPQLTKLPYLREIDFAYNYLNGTIPQEWASLQLTSISVLVNRLSGKIPKELGNLTTLTFLNLEVNRFSGVIPPELGRLVNLQNLLLSSNQLTGNLPMAFARLVNLTDLRINDNSFNGRLPDFIQNWKRLKRLEMHASGLEGPLPQNISLLSNLVELRVSDMHSLEQDFPKLEDMTNLGFEKL